MYIYRYIYIDIHTYIYIYIYRVPHLEVSHMPVVQVNLSFWNVWCSEVSSMVVLKVPVVLRALSNTDHGKQTFFGTGTRRTSLLHFPARKRTPFNYITPSIL